MRLESRSGELVRSPKIISDKQYCHVGTLPNNADRDCFKTPILQEILRIQNLHQVEHCAFWEVIHTYDQLDV